MGQLKRIGINILQVLLVWAPFTAYLLIYVDNGWMPALLHNGFFLLSVFSGTSDEDACYPPRCTVRRPGKFSL